jgi:hypothetical protein
MMIKSYFSKIYAKNIAKNIRKWSDNPLKTQDKVFNNLIDNAKQTDFGKDHFFENINSYQDFKKQVPIRDYESLKSYINKIINGKSDVLWKGKPLYFAKTSGTTSGAKYIPITKESMPYHVKGAKDALLLYIYKTGKSGFINGKMIFLQGSPIINSKNKIKTGRLSGIVAHYVPKYLQKNRMPSWQTNCIDDWETKINTIVNETIDKNMTLISGIPPWVQMYFEKLIEKSGKKVGELFPNFKLFVYGGVNYEPYRQKMENLIGRKVDSIELFPASEGFFAFQDVPNKIGMLLVLDGGIFYEFIKASDFFNENPERITLKDVELHINYVLIISTNAGLWAYNIGDTVQFISLKPFRIIVSGRIKHFISAFGEHVIVKEVEYAIQETIKNTKVSINEFTVAPQINPNKGLPYHEWFIEFENEPDDLNQFSKKLDAELVKQNSYYKDLIDGKVLRTLVIAKVKPNGFQNYMKSIGKLGGQNKIPRLSDNRAIVDKLECLIL